MKALGLCTIYIGISGAFKGENTLVMIISNGISGHYFWQFLLILISIKIVRKDWKEVFKGRAEIVFQGSLSLKFTFVLVQLIDR